MRNPEKLTSLVMLNMVTSFSSVYPEEKYWNLENFKNDYPSYIQLQQISILMKVFLSDSLFYGGLEYDIRNVLSGEFIEKRDISVYSDLLVEMDREFTASTYQFDKKEPWNTFHIRHHYKDLLEYRQYLTKILNINSGIMEISYPYLYSVQVIDKINANIDISQIDMFLSLAIDPQKRSFDKEYLISEYGYPKEDVYMLQYDDF